MLNKHTIVFYQATFHIIKHLVIQIHFLYRVIHPTVSERVSWPIHFVWRILSLKLNRSLICTSNNDFADKMKAAADIL